MNFLLMYTTDNILLVLLTKHLVHHDGEPTMPHKLATSMKLLLSNLRVLFCPWAVQKATAHDDIKALNMHHKSKKIVVSLLESHNIKKGTSSTYLLHEK